MRFFISGLFLLVFICSCQEPTTIAGFDKPLWQKDKEGCNGQRQKLVAVLIQQEDKLKGQNQQNISSILGRPNSIKLLSRNQKQYTYTLAGGKDCSSKAEKKLIINFNATGFVNNLTIY